MSRNMSVCEFRRNCCLSLPMRAVFRLASSLCWKVVTKLALSASTASRIFRGTHSGQGTGNCNDAVRISIFRELEVEVDEVEESSVPKVSVEDDLEAAVDFVPAAGLLAEVPEVEELAEEEEASVEHDSLDLEGFNKGKVAAAVL